MGINRTPKPDEWEREREHLLLHIAELTRQVNWWQAQWRLLTHHRFGASQERSDQIQLHLFNEAEVLADDDPDPGDAAEDTVITYRRKKQRGQRELDLADLPVVRILHELPEAEQQCPAGHGLMHIMSEDVQRELDFVPEQLRVVEHVKMVYSCRTCEREALTVPIVTAPAPPRLYPSRLLSASVLAEIVHRKYVLGVPLYRQEQDWARRGVWVSRQTMANWVLVGADQWLTPLWDVLHQELVRRSILQADETTLQVIHEPGRTPNQQSYLWLYRTGEVPGDAWGEDGAPIVLYDYQPSRSGAHPQAFLTGFHGYLQVDGYSGYHGLEGVTLVGCWAHARRKFQEALEGLPAQARDGPNLIRQGLDFCNRLFAVERDIRALSPAQRTQARRARSRPILAAFLRWLRAQRRVILPKSLLGTAVTYCLNQWQPLTTFLQDGRLTIDNNRAERSIKPFVIGRKNWLFANTAKGARASAVIYSIVETAKENGLNPRAYLQYLLEQLPDRDLSDPTTWADLLPWATTLPAHVRTPRRVRPA